MGKSSLFHYLLASLLLALLAVSCSPASSGGPEAIESYLEALVARDLNQMINYSCSEWEDDAKQEFDSFAAVSGITLEEVTCTERERDGDYILVSCTGRIVADYGAEDLVIDLHERPFRVVEEGGEPRMCGYE